uniref:Uncharacterized protein n=1 Tax=Romanomermis culicivorax TaxID=13658 RepID=A0A915IQ11_ROMCU
MPSVTLADAWASADGKFLAISPSLLDDDNNMLIKIAMPMEASNVSSCLFLGIIYSSIEV